MAAVTCKNGSSKGFVRSSSASPLVGVSSAVMLSIREQNSMVEQKGIEFS
jgi:hypothetical protein